MASHTERKWKSLWLVLLAGSRSLFEDSPHDEVSTTTKTPPIKVMHPTAGPRVGSVESRITGMAFRKIAEGAVAKATSLPLVCNESESLPAANLKPGDVFEVVSPGWPGQYKPSQK